MAQRSHEAAAPATTSRMPRVLATDRFLFFWGGWPSQWVPAPFAHGGVTYTCCEQWMMAEKARVFGDADALRAILATDDPGRQKAIGRGVRGFDGAVWARVCRGVVFAGNRLRFEQNEDDRELLLSTGERTLVEASPTDRIWGIGLAMDDPRVHEPAQWQGTNWLGVALMQVRDVLRGEPLCEVVAEQLAARRELGG